MVVGRREVDDGEEAVWCVDRSEVLRSEDRPEDGTPGRRSARPESSRPERAQGHPEDGPEGRAERRGQARGARRGAKDVQEVGREDHQEVGKAHRQEVGSTRLERRHTPCDTRGRSRGTDPVAPGDGPARPRPVGHRDAGYRRRAELLATATGQTPFSHGGQRGDCFLFLHSCSLGPHGRHPRSPRNLMA